MAYLRLRQELVVLDDVKELTLAQLCDYHELLVGLKGVQQQHDVLVLQLLQDLDFFPHTHDVLLLLVPALHPAYFFLMVLIATNWPVPLRRALKT